MASTNSAMFGVSSPQNLQPTFSAPSDSKSWTPNPVSPPPDPQAWMLNSVTATPAFSPIAATSASAPAAAFKPGEVHTFAPSVAMKSAQAVAVNRTPVISPSLASLGSVTALFNSSANSRTLPPQQQQQPFDPSRFGVGPNAGTASATTSSMGSGPDGQEGDKYNAQVRAILSNVIGPNGEQLTSADPYNTTVFVGGLSPLIAEDTLRTFFAPFGDIHYVKVPAGKHCGFVQFVRKHDAERAIEKMQGFPIGGSRIRLSWGRSQCQ